MTAPSTHTSPLHAPPAAPGDLTVNNVEVVYHDIIQVLSLIHI